jgi:hypothetical protein
MCRKNAVSMVVSRRQKYFCLALLDSALVC